MQNEVVMFKSFITRLGLLLLGTFANSKDLD